jgi:hypothetical protein
MNASRICYNSVCSSCGTESGQAVLAQLREQGEENVLFTNSASDAAHDKQRVSSKCLSFQFP